MALKLPASFPIFAPPSPQTTFPCPYPNSPSRRLTVTRVSRGNSANAEKFNQRPAPKEIEDDNRRHRRHESAATSISRNQNGNFKSQGTTWSPRPSIPVKKSKYSKPGKKSKTLIPPRRNPIEKEAKITLAEDGVSYLLDGAPFEFKYSYTETPKEKPLKLREPYAPFGPTTMHRPWTGRAPFPPSQKKLKEFDSFILPPPDKKGVKPVQKPGPFLPGTGPRYVKSREEILGEPLTKEEVQEMIKSCLKSERQLNMGRDGLTHNMLDNIHAHWKRRRVCKIKCKGVCTVDMENVCEQLEERTGGKVIYRRGGAVFLFRGRNYNYKNRPRFPLMLWKPAAPVYPRLVERTPEGLTLEEATEMRRKGRELMPICKLAKNGVYSNLVSNVREAFELCELVRIDCQGVKGSDYHKIGAKLKDLVPCVLISFENEHILIWRGRDWKPSLPNPGVNSYLQEESNGDAVSKETNEMELYVNSDSDDESDGSDTDYADAGSEAMSHILETEKNLDGTTSINIEPEAIPVESGVIPTTAESTVNQSDAGLDELQYDSSGGAKLDKQYSERVLLLLNQAVESGSAVILDDLSLDADEIFARAVAFAKSAPPGPVFKHQPKKAAIHNSEKQEPGELEGKEFTPVPWRRGNDKKSPRTQRRKDPKEHLDTVPAVSKGTLRVDELAKLLS